MLADIFIDVRNDNESLRETIRSLAIAELRGYLEALEKALLILSHVKDKVRDGNAIDVAISLISELQSWASEKLDIILEDGDVEILIERLNK